MSSPELTTMVDTNVLLDVLHGDDRWGEWSRDRIVEAREVGPLVINPIIYAEVSVYYSRVEDLDRDLPRGDFVREPLPFRAGFMAGKVFLKYRRQGGVRRSPLPDFYIGAHATARDYRLLTRVGARYRSYFPKLRLRTPEDP
ncbi:type II toxin-antitoxin system VapC family toxin [Pseudonocardia eucalypti]|uniref:Type II toxin-antitoxin system VapC family toxin n=1 Tax=Pseudonocardia eucalypti TaxID=648755 RepID=A0ABP9REC5_9PSEU|nr:putative nucleic acid-binding protein [Pseudonocardia eucalypti]